MENECQGEKHIHQGNNVKRVRLSKGMKQFTLGELCGMPQQSVSEYEKKQVIDKSVLERFAKALDVSVELLQNMEMDPVSVIIENNNFEKGSIGNIMPYGENENVGNIYNPIDQLVDLFKELLKREDEKIQVLKSLLEKKNNSTPS